MADRIPPEVLYPRRLAWRALSVVLDQYNLQGITLKLNPNDPAQALPGAGRGEVEFYEDYRQGAGRVIATVLLDGAKARVLVERIDRLVRRNHLAAFVPREVGIVQRRGAPDIDAEVDLSEIIETDGEVLRTVRQRLLPPASRPRPPSRAIRAFGSSR